MIPHRIIFLMPEGLSRESLSEEQNAAIDRVFGQYVFPMPGSIATVDGLILCDALVDSSFSEEAMQEVGLPFQIIGRWNSSGALLSEFAHASYAQCQPSGFPIESHRWAGWPPCEGFSQLS